eukprot:TRINITY_DN46449_c0_g1_i1.p1 TRINITY_DN46449_c0_g1~~TRINITY_DN46449_c0_g1_i1.p1  ORF type:complete len:437 (-),score=81.98 TRINITY_DN46449_c0_g1_i1:34-1344(-)
MTSSNDGARRVCPILGTMTFGQEGQIQPADGNVLLRSFCGSGAAKTSRGVLIDTARIYQQAAGDGDTEATLGDLFAQSPSLVRRVSIATKANPMMDPHRSLSKQSVIDQCNTSLEKLGVDCIDLFYLHSPDIATSMDDTLEGVEHLHREGKIKEFGLSNYPAWAVVDIWYRCKARGMVLPTVYQGMYNVITRDMEREIVPVAREFGLRLYMYNPLAAGLLTGRYSTIDDLEAATEGRFSSEFDRAFGDDIKAGSVYRARYGKLPLLEGVAVLRQACNGGEPSAASAAADVNSAEQQLVQDTEEVVNGVRVRVQITESNATDSKTRAPLYDMPNVALRWLIHHSLLRDGDGVILGVSKVAQLGANLKAWLDGPLPPEVVAACDAAWEAARPACESYFRGYGAKAGGVERFLALKEASKEAPKDEGEATRKDAKAETS